MFDLVATAVADATFTSVADLSQVFGRDSFTVAWSTRAGDAQPTDDYHPVSQLTTVRFDRYTADDDGLALRGTLPGIALVGDTVAESEERFGVLLKRAPGLDYRMRIRTDAADRVVTIRDRQNGDLRLADGDASYESRGEVFYDRQWGTICGDFWTDNEAGLACRQLGFAGSEPDSGRFLREYSPSGSGPLWLDNVVCDGDGARLVDCPRLEGLEIGEHNCEHTEDVGIRCLMAPASPAPDGALLLPLRLPWQ